MKILDFYPANCKNCYKCVRNCSVKAIRMIDDQAQVVEEKCIACGKCFLVCPQNARKINSDLKNVTDAVASGRKVIVSIAPSYLGVYEEPYKLISALRNMGIEIIEETSIGAQQVTEIYKKYIKDNNIANAITTCCPSANMMVQTYYPELIKYLIPVVSPMIAHCKMIRKRHGDEAYIVFLGPCISKKCEAFGYQEVGTIDAVISFEELDSWMEENSIDISKFEDSKPDLEGDRTGKKYPLNMGISSGMLDSIYDSGLVPLYVSGTDNLKGAFAALSKGELNNVFMEVNSCSVGCIGGPAVPRLSRNHNVMEAQAVKKIRKIENEKFIGYSSEEKELDYERHFRDKKYVYPKCTEDDIKKILESIGKFTKDDELNCGACGYDSCRDKAISVIEGLSHPHMCMPYMRSEAEKITNVIFDYSPNILIILDLDLNILDINPVGQKAFNTTLQNMRGRHISTIIESADYEEVLKTGQNVTGKKMAIENYGITVHESIIYLPKNKIIFGILNDITEEEKKKDQLINLKLSTLETADQVIEKQMRVAQEIAGLLGETTAETKAALIKLKKVVMEERVE